MDRDQRSRHERDLARLARLRPIDDDFMRCLFEDNLPLAQDVLRTLTGVKTLSLVEQQTQHDLHRLVGSRSACLDVWGRDADGTVYDLEIQRGGRPRPRRARYHSAMMDVEALNEGDDFEALPESYVIFVMERDPFGRGAGIYRFERGDAALGLPLSDGAHVLYANAAYRGDDELGSLMRDFCESDPDRIENPLLAERAGYLKRDPKGASQMCEVFEEIMQEGREEGRAEGRKAGREEGREERALDDIRQLRKNLKLTEREAFDALGVPEDRRERYLALL